MTIKQQGGIFGRNPTFNEVDLDTLKIDGVEVTATATELNYVDIATLGQSQANKAVTANSSGHVFVGNKTVLSDTEAGHAFSGGSLSGLTYHTRDNGLVMSVARLNGDGDMVRFVSNGANVGTLTSASGALFLKPANGGGIDFSATSGTGTSELFSDYEEGTWTAYLRGSVGEPSPFKTTTGYYTKVGDVITAWVKFDSIDATGYSGNALIYGLPFTSGSNSNPINACICNQLNTTTLVGTVNPSSTILNILQDTGSAATYSSPTTGFSLTVQVTYKE